MKERGMIFNAEMVRALLDGGKTQTRRPVKPQPELKKENLDAGFRKYWTHKGKDITDKHDEFLSLCPFGQIGDRIWVRETFASIFKDEGPVCYRATDSSMHSGAWKPSIHMPRWASRITLEITDIRVERVQDISIEDAMSEIASTPLDKRYVVQEEFKPLWDSIYGNWNDNPWVWVIEFKRIDNQQATA